MTDNQEDRRVQRTRKLLQAALMGLLAEQRFDKITVQDIIERANVGRTTFYAHFQSKEDLFLSGHDMLIVVICRSFFSEGGGLSEEPSAQLVAFLEEAAQQSRDVFFYLTWGSETGEIIRLLKERIAAQLEIRLRELYSQEHCAIPFEVLAQHVAGSIVSLSSWWLGKATPYSALEIATMLHQMNQAALRQALRL
ncbi:MAG: TetR/AcrR family transcriptional regulator [Anaerolineae bacterium]